MVRTLLLAGLLSLASIPAQADDFSDALNKQRARLNPLGDKALEPGGDTAFDELLLILDMCDPASKCKNNEGARTISGVAAANLAHYYREKSKSGGDWKLDELFFYAHAAALDNPFGYYWVAECLSVNCLTEDEAYDALSPLYSESQISNHFSQETWFRIETIVKLYRQAADLGMALASFRYAEANMYFVAEIANAYDNASGNSAVYVSDYFYAIIEYLEKGLAQNPTPEQAQQWNEMLSRVKAEKNRLFASISIQPTTSEARNYLKGLKERLKTGLAPAAPPAPSSPATATKAASKSIQHSQKYYDDLDKLEECRNWGVKIQNEEKSIEAEDRALDNRDRELNRMRMNIENSLTPINPNDPNNAFRRAQEQAMWNAYHAEERAYNRQVDSYNEHLRLFASRNDQFENACAVAFDSDAVADFCDQYSSRDKFCSSFEN